MYFLHALTIVSICLFYMIPAFLLGKFNLAKESHLKTISAILLYICTPSLIISSLLQVEYSKELLINLILFFICALLCQIVFTLILFLFLRKRMDNPKARITMIASSFGNVGFFGIPLISAVFPDQTIVLAYACLFMISLNLLSFTLGSFCITGEKKYISIKRAFLNPATLAFIVGLIPFFFKVTLTNLNVFGDALSLLGRLSTPLCMFMLGIRLAYVNFKKLFTNKTVYISCLLKQVIYPLFIFGIFFFIPGLDKMFKASLFVLCTCPCAAVIASLSELYHKEEDTSSNIVLFSTISSVITIPLLMFLLQTL